MPTETPLLGDDPRPLASHADDVLVAPAPPPAEDAEDAEDAEETATVTEVIDGDVAELVDERTTRSPVFVDTSGRRARLVRRIGVGLATALAVYLAAVSVSLVAGADVPLTPWTGGSSSERAPADSERNPRLKKLTGTENAGQNRGLPPPGLVRPSGGVQPSGSRPSQTAQPTRSASPTPRVAQPPTPTTSPVPSATPSATPTTDTPSTAPTTPPSKDRPRGRLFP